MKQSTFYYLLRRGAFGGGSSDLLSKYKAFGGFSLRKVGKTDYAIQVRRDSDNALLDIGFVGDDLDTATLTSFCGAGNGYIQTWYNQDGSGNDFTSYALAEQPQIVNAGAVILQNGKPAIFAPTTSLFNLTPSTKDLTSAFHIFTVVKATALAQILRMNGGEDNITIAPSYTRWVIDLTQYNADTSADFIGSQIVLEAGRDSNNDLYSFINQESNTFTTSSNDSNGFLIEWIRPTADIYIQEMLIFANDQIANRALIAKDINDYFSVFAASAPSIDTTPTISGAAIVGGELTAVLGDVSGTPTPTSSVQWQVSTNGTEWANISGETSSTYTILASDEGKYLRFVQTASSIEGSDTANSAATSAVTSFTGLLDTYTGAEVAYALNLLSSSYAGPAIKVRRSSDNLEVDISFDGDGNLDTTALLAHCGSGDGFITTFYDQSGNGNDLLRSVAADQPQIVSAGVVVVDPDTLKPSFTFPTPTTRLHTSGLVDVSFANTFTFVAVGRMDIGNTYSIPYSNNAGDDRYMIYSGNHRDIIDGTAYIAYNGETRGAMHIFSQVRTSSNALEIRVDNATYGTISSVSGSFGFGQIGSNLNANPPEYFSAFIGWAADQTANISGIENELNNYYSIY